MHWSDIEDLRGIIAERLDILVSDVDIRQIYEHPGRVGFQIHIGVNDNLPEAKGRINMPSFTTTKGTGD